MLGHFLSGTDATIETTNEALITIVVSLGGTVEEPTEPDDSVQE